MSSSGGFEEATAVRQVDSGREGESAWAGHVVDTYNVLKVPNGGYLTAIVVRALRAAQAAAGDPNLDLLSLNCTFTNSSVANQPCLVRVQPLKRGRKISSVQCWLEQGKGPSARKIFGVALFGEYAVRPMRSLQGAERVANHPDLGPMPSSSEELYQMSGAVPPGRPIFERFSTRLPERDLAAFTRMVGLSEAQVPCEYRALMRHESPSDRLTVESLACISDANVPCVKAALPSTDRGWVPTLSLDLQFFRAPAPGQGEVLAHFSTHSLSDSRNIEQAELYDPRTMELLSISRQSALLGIEQSKKTPAPSSRL